MQLAKLIMTWDIVPGQEQEYFDFNAREFVPRLMKLGLRPMDSWFRLYGEVPQIVVGWVSEDPEIIRKAVLSPEWREIQDELEPLVRNFRYAVTEDSGPFQV